jgi:hypothetical protein
LPSQISFAGLAGGEKDGQQDHAVGRFRRRGRVLRGWRRILGR